MLILKRKFSQYKIEKKITYFYISQQGENSIFSIFKTKYKIAIRMGRRHLMKNSLSFYEDLERSRTKSNTKPSLSNSKTLSKKESRLIKTRSLKEMEPSFLSNTSMTQTNTFSNFWPQSYYHCDNQTTSTYYPLYFGTNSSKPEVNTETK